MTTLKVDPVLLVLLFATFVFTGLMLFAEFKFKDDGQLFQVMSNLVSGFGGAFLMRAKPQTHEEEKPPGTTELKKTTILESSPAEEAK